MKDSDILDILIRQTHSKPEICQSSNNCNKFSHIIIQLYIIIHYFNNSNFSFKLFPQNSNLQIQTFRSGSPNIWVCGG